MSQSTLLLFLSQWPFILVVKKVYKIVMGITLQGNYLNPLEAILVAALVMASMYPLVAWVRKRLPILAGIYKNE